MCAAASNESTLVHVLTLGYAAAPISTSVAGVLSLAGVATATSAVHGGVAAGSAAGGVVLTLSGEGFGDDAARMQVLLRAGTSAGTGASSGDTLASCAVLSSSSVLGTLTCRTLPSASPLADAGALCGVRVTALTAAGGVVGTSDMLDSFQMLSSSSSPLVEVQPSPPTISSPSPSPSPSSSSTPTPTLTLAPTPTPTPTPALTLTR